MSVTVTSTTDNDNLYQVSLQMVKHCKRSVTSQSLQQRATKKLTNSTVTPI